MIGISGVGLLLYLWDRYAKTWERDKADTYPHTFLIYLKNGIVGGMAILSIVMKTDLLKLLTSLVVAVLCSANSYAYYDEVWEWEDVGVNEAIITGCNPEVVVGDVVVPSYVYKRLVDEFGQPIQTLEARAVTYIGDGAFKNCKGITSLTLPSELISVGTGAFSGCSALKELIVPSSDRIKDPLGLELDGCPIESLTIGRDFGCSMTITKLLALTLTEGVTRFPSLINMDESSAFYDHIVNVKRVYTCDSLWMTLDWSQHEPAKEEWELLNYDGEPITTLDYREKGIDEIYWQNANCTTLKSVYLPTEMTELREETFLGCKALEYVELPLKLGKLWNNVFKGCESLKTINIPEGWENLNLYAFPGLESIYLPSTLKEMEGTLSVSDVFVPSLECWMGIQKFYGSGIQTSLSGKLNIGGEPVTDLYLPEGIDLIPLQCFTRINISKVHLPNSLKIIEPLAFCECSDLKEVELGKGLESIGDYAFGACPISHVDFPSTLTGIGMGAFYLCNIEGTLLLPDNLSELGSSCFTSNKIEKIVLPQCLDSVPAWAFRYNPLLCFPDLSNVRTLSYQCFANTTPASLTLPGNVKSLGAGVFRQCENLKDVVIADTDEALECKMDGGLPFSPFDESPVENLYIGRDVTGKLFDKTPSLQYLTLGSKVSVLTDLDCTLFAGLKLLESKALTPPAMNEFTADQYANVEVVVPEEALEAYKSAPVWKNFLKLNTSTAIDDIATDSEEVVSRSYYDLQGRLIDNPETGLFICHETLSDGRTVVRKVILR